MTCPFHDDDSDPSEGETDGAPTSRDRDGGLERRAFVKSALLIGGTSALSSLDRRAGITTTVRAEGAGRVDAATRLNRQHAWDRYEPRTASGNTVHPPHSLFLMLDYRGEGEPTPDHRRRVENALAEIERHFAWRPNGVMFTIAYSASYFDRFDEDPPAGAAPDGQRTVAETVEGLTDLADTNDDVTPDAYDAVLLLASANEANLLAVEAALWGEDSDLDISFDATFEGVFTKPEAWPDRRVGFGGPGFQEREAEYEEKFLDGADEIPDEAPLSMGYIAGFGESIPEEEIVTLKRGQRFPGPDVDESAVPTDLDYVGEVGERDPGVFAQGTLKHLSHLEIDLGEWYGEDSAQRRHQMYSPYHDEAETETDGDKPGSGLTAADEDDIDPDSPRDDEYTVLEYAERTPETAAGDETAETSEPTTAHSQKSARARYDVDGDGEHEQPVIRRDWDTITPTGTDGDETAGYLFNVPMRFNESIYSLLDANYNVGFTSLDGRIDHDPVENDRVKERNGIAPYMTATRRGNWLVPPITVRALPYPRADRATLSVDRDGDAYVVAVSGIGRVVDTDTIRFGERERVHQARGARPADVWAEGGDLYVEVPTDEVEAGPGDAVAFFAKQRDTEKPVLGTTTL